jgi:hypothetical protein
METDVAPQDRRSSHDLGLVYEIGSVDDLPIAFADVLDPAAIQFRVYFRLSYIKEA